MGLSDWKTTFVDAWRNPQGVKLGLIRRRQKIPCFRCVQRLRKIANAKLRRIPDCPQCTDCGGINQVCKIDAIEIKYGPSFSERNVVICRDYQDSEHDKIMF